MGFSLSDLDPTGISSIGDLFSPDLGGATAAASFNPYDISTSYGSATYSPTDRTFTSQLDPRLQSAMSGLFSQYGAIDPAQQLNLMREQAQPYEQAQSLGLENRLFSQGLMGASKVDQPGGARRSLFDSFQNADLNRQIQAQQLAQQSQANILNQIFGLTNLEQSLFAPQASFGAIQTGAGANQANLMAQEASFIPNLIGNLGGSAIQGYTTGMGARPPAV